MLEFFIGFVGVVLLLVYVVMWNVISYRCFDYTPDDLFGLIALPFLLPACVVVVVWISVWGCHNFGTNIMLFLGSYYQ